jgi:outer membrane protein assembly factor BamB
MGNFLLRASLVLLLANALFAREQTIQPDTGAACNFIVINWDHEGQSFIVALDKRTGKEIWKADRDEITSWATPLIVEHPAGRGKPQVIINATNRVRSYDLATGKVLWEIGGMTVNTIPSPVAANNMVYVTSGFRSSALLAIRRDAARGDLKFLCDDCLAIRPGHAVRALAVAAR